MFAQIIFRVWVRYELVFAPELENLKLKYEQFFLMFVWIIFRLWIMYVLVIPLSHETLKLR